MTNLPSSDDNVEQFVFELGLDAPHVHALHQADHADDYGCEDRWESKLGK